MKIIDLNFSIPNLKGEPIIVDDGTKTGTELNAAELLANALAQSKEGDAVKYVEWALALTKRKPIYLYQSDEDALIKFIEKAGFSNLVQYHLKQTINNTESESESESKPKKSK